MTDLFTSREAWEAAVPNWAAAEFAGDLPVPSTLDADTPLDLSGGATVSVDQSIEWKELSGGPAGTYLAKASASNPGTLVFTFSQPVEAFGMDINTFPIPFPATITITLSDANQWTWSAASGTTYFRGWAGGAITSMTIVIDASPFLWSLNLGSIVVLGGAPKTHLRIGAGFIKRAVDLQVTTTIDSISGTERVVDQPTGSHSWPEDHDSAAMYTFPERADATERVWHLGINLAFGAIWHIGVGSHLDNYDSERILPTLPTEYLLVGEPAATALTISGSGNIQIAYCRCEVQYPTTRTPGSSTTTTGRQIAEMVYNLEVAADVEGWADDGSGTYTGVPNTLILRPADILRHVAVQYLGWSAGAGFDAATFAAARAAEAAAGIRLDFVLRQPIHSAELFERIRHQSMSAHFLSAEGTYKRWLYPFSRTPVKTFTESDDTIGLIRVGLTPLRELYNVVGIRFAPNADGHWAGYVEKQDTISQGTGHPPTPGYGTVNRWIQDFDLVRDPQTADVVAGNWLAWLKGQPYRVNLDVPIEWIHLEPWDCIGVSSERMPGGWTGKRFLIQTMRKRLGDEEAPDTVTLIAREAPE